MRKLLLTLLACVALPAQAQLYNLFGPVNGVLKGATTTPQTSAAASADIIALWTGTCNSTTFMRADGTCQAVSASPANPANSVQYNNAGAFGGSVNFTFDGTHTVTLGDATTGVLVSPAGATNTAGSILAITAGAGNGTGAGAALNLTAGAGGATNATGGNANLKAGAAGGTAFGGTLTIAGGIGGGGFTPGEIIIPGSPDQSGTTALDMTIIPPKSNSALHGGNLLVNNFFNAQSFAMTPDGNVTCGTCSIASSSTDGFIYINSSTSTPTGTPAHIAESYTSTSTVVRYDQTHNILWAYNSGWVDVANNTTAPISKGTTFTITSGCATTSALTGGATAGSFATTTTGTCTPVIALPTAPNGWSCYASDLTHPVVYSQTASTTASCTVSGASVSGDTIIFHAIGF